MVPERERPDLVTSNKYFECNIAADLSLVAAALGQLHTYCGDRGLAEETWRDIELAVAEALNNAIEHGCADKPEARVRLRWNWSGELFEAQVLDPGTFVPGGAGSPGLPEDPFAEGGRGGFLMAALMDSVEHRRIDGLHCLFMRKHVGKKKSVRDAEDTAALLDAMTEDLSNTYESLTTVYRFGEEMATSPSFDHFARRVLERLTESLGADEAQLSFATDGTLAVFFYHGSKTPVASSPDEHVTLTALTSKIDTIETRVFNTPYRWVAVEECVKLAQTDPLWRVSGVVCACPVLFQGHALGVLSIVRRGGAKPFTAPELHLVRAVSDFLGIARANDTLQEQRRAQQRVLRELEIAAEIQQSLLPKRFPNTAKSRIFGVSHAALEVGGDYFDALPVGDHGVLVAIADVMGKGMSAALMAVVLRTAIRARIDLAEEPGRLLSEVNEQISADLGRLDMFITAQIAYFSYETGYIVYSSAGHCPILMYRRGETVARRLEVGGVPLGVLDDARYDRAHEIVAPGDRFVFLTDGIYEAHAPNGEILGLDQVAERIPALWTGGSPAFCFSLLETVRTWSGGAAASDDRTLVTLECL